MACMLDAINDILRCDRPRVELAPARLIDRQNQRVLRIAECGAELVEERRGAIRSMRLEHHPDLALRHGARRAQHSRDFRWMMSVVIHDPDSTWLALRLKPASRALA